MRTCSPSQMRDKMGHIELSRDADLLLVAPATADILAKMRAGLADDLATTALLATDKPVMAAPAMNVRMWDHSATQENIRALRDRGISVIGPEQETWRAGNMEWGGCRSRRTSLKGGARPVKIGAH